ncbi:uncharacterized protein MONOS_17986 [Monocercomonoides exilis]|uniref:uncharacterized protein n=1 Tax=Monocercomonoides exilis TaxID=2049356 RepID=UPI003559EF47|nr:hypothetical protein MONOS_17986 [Monocercomonoides exilis]
MEGAVRLITFIHKLCFTPRSEERGARVQEDEAKKAEYNCKMNAVQRKGKQYEEPKVKTKKKEKDEFCTSQIDAFDTRLAQAATERRRRDRGREERGNDKDEQQQISCSFDSSLSSAQLHTQNITASSTFASPPFSPLPHVEFSVTSVLVGTPPKPLTQSSPATDSSSVSQEFNCTSLPSSASSSNMPPSSSPTFSSSNNSFIGLYDSRNATANRSSKNLQKFWKLQITDDQENLFPLCKCNNSKTTKTSLSETDRVFSGGVNNKHNQVS